MGKGEGGKTSKDTVERKEESRKLKKRESQLFARSFPGRVQLCNVNKKKSRKQEMASNKMVK